MAAQCCTISCMCSNRSARLRGSSATQPVRAARAAGRACAARRIVARPAARRPDLVRCRLQCRASDKHWALHARANAQAGGVGGARRRARIPPGAVRRARALRCSVSCSPDALLWVLHCMCARARAGAGRTLHAARSQQSVALADGGGERVSGAVGTQPRGSHKKGGTHRRSQRAVVTATRGPPGSK